MLRRTLRLLVCMHYIRRMQKDTGATVVIDNVVPRRESEMTTTTTDETTMHSSKNGCNRERRTEMETDAFTVCCISTSGCEIRDPSGKVVAWTVGLPCG